MPAITINGKRSHESEKKPRQVIWKDLEGGKGKRKWCDYSLNKIKDVTTIIYSFSHTFLINGLLGS